MVPGMSVRFATSEMVADSTMKISSRSSKTQRVRVPAKGRNRVAETVARPTPTMAPKSTERKERRN